MRFPIPGPADLLNAASSVRDGLGDALELVPRLGVIVGEVEGLLSRVSRLLDRVEVTVERADALVAGVAATDQAAQVVVASAEATSARALALLDLYEDPLRALAPSVRTLVDTLEPDEVAAMVKLVDRLPVLLAHLDEDILPVLATLDRVGPDLHQLLEIAQDIQVAIGGLPGMGWIRKRAEKEEDEADRQARAIDAAKHTD